MKLERRQQQDFAVNHMLGEVLLMVQERRHPTLILDAIKFFSTQPEDICFGGNDASLATAA
jgi:flagellar motor component MotA